MWSLQRHYVLHYSTPSFPWKCIRFHYLLGDITYSIVMMETTQEKIHMACGIIRTLWLNDKDSLCFSFHPLHHHYLIVSKARCKCGRQSGWGSLHRWHRIHDVDWACAIQLIANSVFSHVCLSYGPTPSVCLSNACSDIVLWTSPPWLIHACLWPAMSLPFSQLPYAPDSSLDSWARDSSYILPVSYALLPAYSAALQAYSTP